jgi:hypothetical protein
MVDRVNNDTFLIGALKLQLIGKVFNIYIEDE